jgi:hypothetical protein
MDAAHWARRDRRNDMARWIDMTDAQKGALNQRLKAQERAAVLANPSSIIKALANIDAQSALTLEEGGKYAVRRALRDLEEKQPIFDRLERLGIDPAEIGIGNKSAAVQRQRDRLAANPHLVGDIVACARLHGLEFAKSIMAARAA